MINNNRVSQAKFSSHYHHLIFGIIFFYNFQFYAFIQVISYTLCLVYTASDFILLKICSLDDFMEESCCQIQTIAQAQKGGHRQGQTIDSNQTPVLPNPKRPGTRNNSNKHAHPAVIASSPLENENENDEEEEEYEKRENPQNIVSLTQFRQLEASLDERFQQSDAVIRFFYEEFGNLMDDKLNQ